MRPSRSLPAREPARTLATVALLFAVLLLPPALSAQEPTSEVEPDSVPARYDVEGLLVDVTRTRQDLARIPQSVSTVGEIDIQVAQRQVTIDEAVRGVPGVFATNRHNFTLGEGVRLSIRAPLARLGTRGLQLLQDGIPLTLADGTTVPNNLDLGSAGRIEVVRGPSSVLYGNSAGGVISVETELPSDRPLLVHPELQFGSNGYNRQQFKVEGSTGRLGYLLNANRMETDGFRTRGAAEIRRVNLVARALVSDDTVLQGIFNLYDMPFGENSSSLTREDALNDPTSVRQLAFDQGWGKSVTQGQGGLSLEHAIGGGHTVRVLGWGLRRDNWNPIPFDIIDLERAAAGLRSEYTAESEIGSVPMEWALGFDVSHQRDDRREYGNEGVAESGGRAREGELRIDQLETVTSLGPFIQTTVRLHSDVGVSLGVRYDRYDFEANDRLLSDGDQSGDRRLSAVSPMAGLTYTPAPNVSLFANYATAYQTPTTVELSNRPDGLGGFNQELDPEYLESFEAGVRGTLPAARIRYEIAGYVSTVEDALLRFEGPSEQAFFRNAGESSRNGIEVALEWFASPELRTRLAYTYQDFEFARFEDLGNDYSGNQEPGSPPHSVFLGLTYDAPFGLRTSTDLRWMDEYAVNDANSEFNWSHTVVDVRAAYELALGGATVRPFAGVDNLLDERYNASVMINAFGSRYYEPAPGRTFYIGLGVGGGR